MSEKHTFSLDERQRAVITGVKDVCSFDENEIVLRLEDSDMVIGGQELHVGRLLLEEGRLDVRGKVDRIAYEVPGPARRLFGFWKKQ